MVRDRIRIETLLSASSTLDGFGGETELQCTLDHRGALVAGNLPAGPGIRNEGVRRSVMVTHLQERGERQCGYRGRSTVSPAPNKAIQRTPTTAAITRSGSPRSSVGAADCWC